VVVDVIEDQFWVAFLAPDRDLSVTHPAYLETTKELLVLPSEDAGWPEYNCKQRKYLAERELQHLASVRLRGWRGCRRCRGSACAPTRAGLHDLGRYENR
jgi:hypothetical protein